MQPLLTELAAALRGRRPSPAAPANPELPAPGTTGPTEIRSTTTRTRPLVAALAVLTIELVPDQWLGHRRAARAGRTMVACVDPDMQRLREKIIFSLLGWLLLTTMTLAIVTRDPAQPGRSGGRPGRLVGFGLLHPLAAERFGEAKLAS
jgi:hypothetical protein